MTRTTSRWLDRVIAAIGGIAVVGGLSLAAAAPDVRPGDSGGGTGIQLVEPSPPTPGPPGTGGLLEVTGSWDVELVRDFISKEMKVAMAAAPVAYTGRDMLGSLNPEFGKRLDALVSIYQAHGGPATTGFVPVSGGLRTPEQQLALFKQCRRMRAGPAGVPVGEGTSKEHWELIPFLDRCCGERNITLLFREEDGTIVPVTMPRAAESNCPVAFHQKQPDGTVWPVLGPSTLAWVSWHNLGLAVDLRDVRRDRRGNAELVLPQDEPWAKLEEAVGYLGMIWGGWWKRFPDPGHVEWHPTLRDPEQFVSRSGTALILTDEQIGYKAAIPGTLFTWETDSGWLSVHELVATGSWISLKSYRSVRRAEHEGWEGHWYSFDPPLRLFPVYLPTIRFSRDESQWPQDMKWRGQTRVVSRTHHHRQKRSDGRWSSESFEATGTAEYRTVVEMEDWQKKANIARHRDDADKDQYIRMKNSSIYDVRVVIEQIEPSEVLAQAARKLWIHRSQEVDEEGYTRDSFRTAGPSLWSILGLALAWNRETGAIGETVSSVQAGKHRFYDLTPTSRFFSSLPAGVWDRETPPDWAPANPRPPRPGHDPCPGCAPRR